MLLISWVQTGWNLWILTSNTLVFTLPRQFPLRVPLLYWRRTFHTSGFHILSLLTMIRVLYKKNLKSSAKREGSSTPNHPLTNETAECLVQTFKKALRKSAQLPKKPLLHFLCQYRRTPTDSKFSSTQLPNGRQIRTKLDVILLSLAQIMQGKQTRAISSNNICIIQSKTSKQVILATHSTLVLNKLKIRDGFQP